MGDAGTGRDRFAAGYGGSPLRGSLRLSKTALQFCRTEGFWNRHPILVNQ